MTTDTKPKPKKFSELSSCSQVASISIVGMFISFTISLGTLGVGVSFAVTLICCVLSEAVEDLIKSRGAA